MLGSVLNEGLLVPVVLYGRETDMERSKIRDVQMDNLRGLLGVRRMIEYRMHRLECCAEQRKG